MCWVCCESGCVEGALHLVHDVGVGCVVDPAVAPHQSNVCDERGEAGERERRRCCSERERRRCCSGGGAVVTVGGDVVVIVDYHLSHVTLFPCLLTRICPCRQSLCHRGYIHGTVDRIEVSGGTSSVDGVEERADAGVVWRG